MQLGLAFKILTKLPICSALRGFEVLFGGISPQKSPLGWREWNFVMVRICVLIFFGMANSYTSYKCMTFQGYTRSDVTDGGKREESRHLASYVKNRLYFIFGIPFFISTLLLFCVFRSIFWFFGIVKYSQLHP